VLLARRSSTELPSLFSLHLVRGVERSERGQSPPIVTVPQRLSECYIPLKISFASGWKEIDLSIEIHRKIDRY